MVKVIISIIALLYFSSTALAAKPILCLEVKAYVLLYGIAAVESWARSNGYTDAQITAIKSKCKAK